MNECKKNNQVYGIQTSVMDLNIISSAFKVNYICYCLALFGYIQTNETKCKQGHVTVKVMEIINKKNNQKFKQLNFGVIVVQE
ncbi:hypothetical protein DERP_002256 [Dermatophagoides pteronyssinus]|uniref:Uncharacterized protein n=1 Tax=Dermatophagoides pteronyssinus TaxID=6956 RepID=A0ABQ8JH74_DERPT|nr:hypothetical protein DERP_002256 [Dermatophagoides pteronyssinus]